MSEVRFLDFNYVFQNATTLTASSADVSFPVSNLKDPRRSKVWRSSGILTAGETVVFDLMTSEEVDSVAVIWSPIDGSNLSGSAVITIEANATNVWTSPALSTTLTLDTDYMTATHFYSSAQEYRYWRLKIVDTANATGFIEIPKVILSKATQLGQTIEIGFKMSHIDDTVISKTPYGQSYSDIYPVHREADFEYSIMSDSDLKTLEQMFQRLGKSGSFALSIDSTGSVFDKDRFFFYGKMTGDLEIQQKFLNYFDTSFKMIESY